MGLLFTIKVQQMIFFCRDVFRAQQNSDRAVSCKISDWVNILS